MLIQFATLENTTIIFFSPSPQKILHNHCFEFPLGLRIIPRETENNNYAIFFFWGGGYKKLIMVFSKVANGNLYTSVLSPMHTILAQEKQLWALTVSHDRSNFVDISVRGHEVPAKFQNHSGCSIVCTCKPNKCKTSFLIYFDLHPKKALKPHLGFLLIFHSTFVTPSGLQK